MLLKWGVHISPSPGKFKLSNMLNLHCKITKNRLWTHSHPPPSWKRKLFQRPPSPSGKIFHPWLKHIEINLIMNLTLIETPTYGNTGSQIWTKIKALIYRGSFASQRTGCFNWQWMIFQLSSLAEAYN